jgi:hypothetical protein
VEKQRPPEPPGLGFAGTQTANQLIDSSSYGISKSAMLPLFLHKELGHAVVANDATDSNRLTRKVKRYLTGWAGSSTKRD